MTRAWSSHSLLNGHIYLLLRSASKVANTALSTTTAGTNLVRWLAKRAGNDLTCKQYMSYVKSLAQTRKWHFEMLGHEQLVKQKAGAFLAVVQGSEHRDYGIAKVVYSPKGANKHLVLVGKGLVFDTISMASCCDWSRRHGATKPLQNAKRFLLDPGNAVDLAASAADDADGSQHKKMKPAVYRFCQKG